MKTLYLLLLLGSSYFLTAQNLGKLVIHQAQAANPDFIISLNGIRLSNQYSSLVNFDNLDETNYHVKVLLFGIPDVLNFNITSSPNYISIYALNKDNYGNYSLILESKTLFGNSTAVTSLPPPSTQTVATGQPTLTTQLDTYTASEFTGVCNTIKKESFESSKLDIAKTFMGTKDISSAQVLAIMKLFSMEKTKVDFTKFAYAKTYDKQNYFKTYDAFNFSSSKKEVSDFIKANP